MALSGSQGDYFSSVCVLQELMKAIGRLPCSDKGKWHGRLLFRSLFENVIQNVPTYLDYQLGGTSTTHRRQ